MAGNGCRHCTRANRPRHRNRAVLQAQQHLRVTSLHKAEQLAVDHFGPSVQALFGPDLGSMPFWSIVRAATVTLAGRFRAQANRQRRVETKQSPGKCACAKGVL